MKRWLGVCGLSLIIVGGMALAQSEDKPKDKQPDMKNMGAALIAALKASPGCLGVETARTSSGKDVIFAWFENKKAVLRWYYSEAHQAAIKMAFPDAKL